MIYALVFISVALASFIWARYISSVSKQRRLKAALWDGLLIGVVAGYTIAYTTDPWNIIPAMLGGALGTFLGTEKPSLSELEKRKLDLEFDEHYNNEK